MRGAVGVNYTASMVAKNGIVSLIADGSNCGERMSKVTVFEDVCINARSIWRDRKSRTGYWFDG